MVDGFPTQLVAPDDFSVAARSLVDMSHLQETVVWLVNQLHRHQDEISMLQQRRDVDIPALALQGLKQRHWMVQKSYKYFYQLASADGFKAFYLEWQRARNERCKWNKASAHAAKTYKAKAAAIWFDVCHEDKRHRHLCRFSLRNIRRNRSNRAFAIWVYAWLMAKQDRQIVRSADVHRAQEKKVKFFQGFKRYTEKSKKYKYVIKKMTMSREDKVKSKIMSAWKFYCDFNYIQERKLYSVNSKKARVHLQYGMHVWTENVIYQKSMRGIVRRTHKYRYMRKLAAAMEDWCFATSMSRKEKLLAAADATGDPVEMTKTMQAVVDGIVVKPNPRQYELQAAALFLNRMQDIKLHMAMEQIHEALENKVEKPTAADIARRARAPAPKAIQPPPSFSSQLSGQKPAAKSTMPSGPSAHKYTDTLQALDEAKAKEEAVKKRLDDKKAALKAAKEGAVIAPVESNVVVPPIHHPDYHYPQYAKGGSFERDLEAEQAQVEAQVAAQVAAEMGQPGMPVSSTRRLLERQYRQEMKMKMAGEPGMGNPIYQQMYADAGAQAALERAVLDAAAATSAQQLDARTGAAQTNYGGSSVLAEARNASMLLSGNLAEESKNGASYPGKQL